MSKGKSHIPQTGRKPGLKPRADDAPPEDEEDGAAVDDEEEQSMDDDEEQGAESDDEQSEGEDDEDTDDDEDDEQAKGRLGAARAVINLPEAAQHPKLAQSLAFDGVSPKRAKRYLKAAGADAKASGKGSLRSTMAGARKPEVGADAPAGGNKPGSALAANAKQRAEKFATSKKGA